MKSVKHSVSFIFLFYFLFSGSSNAQKAGISVSAAQKAYNQFNLKESRDIYQQVVYNKFLPVEEWVTALQNLANQDWKIYQDSRNALKRLSEARKLKLNSSSSCQISGQIRMEEGRYKSALIDVDRARKMAKTDIDLLNARVLYGDIIYHQNVALIAKGGQLNNADLSAASVALKKVLEQQPGKQHAAELLIGISLMLRNGPDLMSGVKSYYFITDERQVNPALGKAYEKMQQVAKKWTKGVLNLSDERDLIISLSDAKFFEYASFYALHLSKYSSQQLHSDPLLSEILHYVSFIKRIATINNRFYPEIARGRTNYDSAYHKAVNIAAMQLWVQLGHQDKYAETSFFEEIKRRFGADGYIGTTVNYYSMLFGHIVHDEIKAIKQYSYEANFRYVAIDRLISQDYTSWYGATNVGGWGNDSTIVQIRKAYLNDPYQRLNWVINAEEKQKMIKRIEETERKDSLRCAQDEYLEPLSSALKIKFNESVEIMDSLKKTGLDHTSLYLAFIAENIRLSVESTIFAHEGRHAIDQLYFQEEFAKMSDDERELRAKLSEVIFSSKPKLALTGSILGSGLNDETNHGKANSRYRKIIVDWMKLHRSEINRLDASKPMLMQLELLTNEQLRKLSIQADPLATPQK